LQPARGMRTGPTLFAVAAMVFAAVPAIADGKPVEPPCHTAGNPAVRSRSPFASAALDYGVKHSPSLQALVDALYDTDIIAYVDSDLRPLGDIWGHVAFISKTTRCRYVRVSITAHLNLTQAAALLGHELQHVYEIATHADVVDDATLSAMYLRYGRRARYENSYESVEAIEMGTRVAAEICGGGAVNSKSSPAETER